MASWVDSLGRLTGEEVYNLTSELSKALVSSSAAMHGRQVGWKRRKAIAETQLETAEILHDVIAQAARITIPMIEAQGIVWRARYARGHPVRMVPADT